MTFSVPPLPYSYDSLEPYIDTETMKEHHDFHHTAYVTGLNQVISEVPQAKGYSLTKLLSETIHDKSIDAAIRKRINNFGGGHYNHSLFWQFMSKDSNAKDIDPQFTAWLKKENFDLEKLKDVFNKSAMSIFGSGWVWLVYVDGKLDIIGTTNQDPVLSLGVNYIPILGLDLWEHAYYLKYKHERKKYVEEWWSVVNWKNVSKFFVEYALKGKPIDVKDDGSIN